MLTRGLLARIAGSAVASHPCVHNHCHSHSSSAAHLVATTPGTSPGEKASVQVAALLGERSSYALAVSGLVLGEGAPGRGSGDARLEQLYMDALGGWLVVGV
jgi:hypothetical protein